MGSTAGSFENHRNSKLQWKEEVGANSLGDKPRISGMSLGIISALQLAVVSVSAGGAFRLLEPCPAWCEGLKDMLITALNSTSQKELRDGTVFLLMGSVYRVDFMASAANGDADGLLLVQCCESTSPRLEFEESLQQRIQHLEQQAFTDYLSDLHNRAGFFSLGEPMLQARKATGDDQLAIVLDVDNLKPVNDRYGHNAGDDLLRGVAAALTRVFDASDLLGRLGGDEFAILTRCRSFAQRRVLLAQIEQEISLVRLAIPHQSIVSVSMGTAWLRSDQSASLMDLTNTADLRMYRSKRAKKT